MPFGTPSLFQCVDKYILNISHSVRVNNKLPYLSSLFLTFPILGMSLELLRWFALVTMLICILLGIHTNSFNYSSFNSCINTKSFGFLNQSLITCLCL